VPDSLPCRDEERKRLGGFLNRALHEGGWVPGAGLVEVCVSAG
jgi:hypothetical protein